MQGKSSNVWEALNKIIQRPKNEKTKKETESTDSMQATLKQHCPTLMSIPKKNVCNINKQRSPRQLNMILIITGKQTFRVSVEMKRTFAKLFLLNELVYASTTARGNTNMESLTVEG